MSFPQPSTAERARTTVAAARTATLTTFPARPPAAPRTTLVSMTADDEGRPSVQLPATSAAVQDLVTRPLATVTASGEGNTAVVLHGAARLLAGRSQPELVTYRLEPGMATVVAGTQREPMDLGEYATAEPDPLLHDAPGLLAHLAAHHVEDLTACLRAHGRASVQWAEPRALDRYGLELAAADRDGVARVRLPFPRPLKAADELGPGLHALLFCQCARRPQPNSRVGRRPSGPGVDDPRVR
jgi:hypothetical protein